MSLKIAQITDIHLRQNIPGPPTLGARRGRDMAERLEAVLTKLESEKIDGLVLTGDLVDAPRWLWKENFYFDDDFDWWTQRTEEDYRLIQTLLNHCSFPTRVLPGNHDYPRSFRKVFGGSWGPEQWGDYHIYGFADWPWRGSQARRVQKERQLFDSALKDVHPQLHFQHYLIAPHIFENYPYNYLEEDELFNRLKAAPQVKGVFQGHYHKGSFAKISSGDSTQFYYTGLAFGEGEHPYMLYQLQHDHIEQEVCTLGSKNKEPRPAVFIDRDGVVTKAPAYYSGPHEQELIPGVGKALSKLMSNGFTLILVSNQTSIGLGYTTKDIVNWTMDQLSRKLAVDGVYFNAIYYSEGAGDRAVLPEFSHQKDVKPDPGLIYKAAKHHQIDLEKSFFVGDRASDVLCARNAGVTPILVKTGYGEKALLQLSSNEPIVVPSLVEAVENILNTKKP